MPLILSRMLLVFDYMLHYFYDPPAALIEQVSCIYLNLHVKAIIITLVLWHNVAQWHETSLICAGWGVYILSYQ